ncbi:hypothetical protein F0225_19055 [Vibrio pectenicida]|uniref:Uncharacterized protein n=1 Tax=Vibrio pectenicida TaxID=62763 RepID=A0A7Y4EGF0_9VIBR|nr:hypothetical protein [Vibrio pectenicida]NOH73413.1 hypothetical protein [Vibrio pectenicida]
MLVIVSYALVEAPSPIDVINHMCSGAYHCLDNRFVSDNTVVNVMCCEYTGYVEVCLGNMDMNVDRIIWMDEYPDTLRFQSCTAKM